MLWIIIAVVASYLIGSIPTAYIFGRVLRGLDIRKFGSGNVGATNALRILGRGAGILVLILDIFKGFIPVVFITDLVLIAGSIPLSSDTLSLLLGLSAILGHIWTVFLEFKGGKGMATALGALLGLAVKIKGLNVVFLLVVFTWLLIFILTKIVSLSSIIAAICLPVYMSFFSYNQSLVYISIGLSILLLLRHKSNIKRLFKGDEPRLFSPKPPK